MTDAAALSSDFTKYDQVEKAHTYRLAEHESDEFDEKYKIATLDLEPFLRELTGFLAGEVGNPKPEGNPEQMTDYETPPPATARRRGERKSE